MVDAMTNELTTSPRRYTGVTVVAGCVVGLVASSILIFVGNDYWPLSAWMLLAGLALCFRATGLFAILVVGGILALLVIPAVNSPRMPAPRNYCLNNIRQLTLAILNYESANGQFPPPFTTDDNGNRLHSWRVLVLPFMEEQELYDQIDLTKPWNHPDNLRLADQMPSGFVCHAASETAPAQTTSYVAVIGPHTIWQKGELTFQDITDGTSQTAILIESESARTHWMAPYDVEINQIVPVAENGCTMLLSGVHPSVGVVAFCDGHVQCLDDDTNADTLKALFTIDGQEEVDVNSL